MRLSVQPGTPLIRFQQVQQFEVPHRADKGFLHQVVYAVRVSRPAPGSAAQLAFVFLIEICKRH